VYSNNTADRSKMEVLGVDRPSVSGPSFSGPLGRVATSSLYCRTPAGRIQFFPLSNPASYHRPRQELSSTDIIDGHFAHLTENMVFWRLDTQTRHLTLLLIQHPIWQFYLLTTGFELGPKPHPTPQTRLHSLSTKVSEIMMPISRICYSVLSRRQASPLVSKQRSLLSFPHSLPTL
jgi:hypothetical protein